MQVPEFEPAAVAPLDNTCTTASVAVVNDASAAQVRFRPVLAAMSNAENAAATVSDVQSSEHSSTAL